MDSKMNHHSHDDMWDWQCDEYNLDYNATPDIYKTLLNGTSQNEDFSCMVDDGTTPVKACGDLPCHENTNKDLDRCNEGSLQVKRRRMLQFASESAETSFSVEDMLRPSFLRSHETQDSFEEPLMEMEQWFTGYSGGESISHGDVADPSSEGWLADCLIDANSSCSENARLNVSYTDASDVLIDITDLRDTLPEFEVEAPPVRTLQNVVFKGRKSYMKSPMKMASAVVSPFAIIKPCSYDGEMTIKDINRRLLDPESKLMKQKKEEDDSSSRFPTSANSGRAIIGKTKIHTEGGKGSITILKTKGFY